ncbi:MAG TPA: NAD-dependent protein deacylase [Gammaproteobacteria bacterium]|nr:NAD-dependent protein deacylase [Gammaproteobacteria bacterium]
MAEAPDTSLARVDEIVGHMLQSSRVLFITGAGISADSGLPTYRGVGGLYDGRITDDSMPIEEAVSGTTFTRRPDITWKYLHEIGAATRGRTCNAGHRAIAGLEPHFDAVWVLTQNVDGFHRAAGSRNVIEIHGNAGELYCTGCDYASRVEDYASLAPLPLCPECGSVIRPRVVLFDEMLPPEAVDTLQRELEAGFDMVFTVGTSAVFPYIAAPVIRARMRGKPTVEIDPGRTELSAEVAYRVPSRAAPALSEIARRFHRRRRADPA